MIYILNIARTPPNSSHFSPISPPLTKILFTIHQGQVTLKIGSIKEQTLRVKISDDVPICVNLQNPPQKSINKKLSPIKKKEKKWHVYLNFNFLLFSSVNFSHGPVRKKLRDKKWFCSLKKLVYIFLQIFLLFIFYFIFRLSFET